MHNNANLATGVVMWEVLTQQDPWHDLPDDNFLDVLTAALQREERPPVPPDCPASYAAVMKACWASQASARPSFTAVLDSECMRSADPRVTAGP